ncbi:hypothetical protein TPL01_16230 [Sulfuriferula plumbiphila]|uniref:Type II secretion system protein n=1 Tax=Sulfuriferula plumbiphila TaxID=171865 RepID=A0A512L7M6_9PROT|nr:hypothetical protein [Sulfuriferula plumbiphila]BBP03998.1 hypothetical protein SFPGR_14200 [Sulfuriferula plumbiphila]GEP30485.1 hypothetical protein TPL01_16230 [Sulfuriferula plumbiphila]
MKYARGGKFCRLTSVILDRGRRVGFTRFELVGIIFIASVLSVLLYDQFLRYQALAEQAVMEMTVINMRSGLRLRVAELMMQDRTDEIGSLLHENPITWLAAPPPNYIGQLAHPEQHAIPANSWYFDSGRHELVYRLRRDKLFEAGPAREKALRFRVTAVHHPQQTGEGGARKVEGVALTMITRHD